MGLFSKVKNAVTGQGEQDELDDIDVDDTFDEAVGDDEPDPQELQETPDPEPEPEPEEEPGPWESAYAFAEWYLEDDGFTGLKEFGEKAAMKRLQESPEYRDRLKTGMETLNTINEAKRQMDEIQGKDDSASDYEEMANKIENANRVIEGVRTLSGEDEMMVQQGMNLARDAIEAISSRAAQGGASGVDTGMTRTEEEL